MSVVNSIIERLEEDLQNKKRQKDGVLDQLILIDVQIDEIISVITNILSGGVSNIEKINESVNKVADAYNARFNAGCVSNLVWELQEEKVYEFEDGDETVQSWKVVLNGGPETCDGDSGVHGHSNYHGIKVWQRPMDRDYGSELVANFKGFVSPGDLAVGMTTAQFGGQSPSAPGAIKVGFVITDDVDNPVAFSASDLPEIVSIGKTESIGIFTSIIGGISTGSNTFYHFGGGDSSILSPGMILLEPIGSGATSGFGKHLSGGGYSIITGFGTDYYELNYYNSDGVLSISTITVPTITIDKPATSTLAEGSFRVGFVTETVGFYISTTAKDFAIDETFFVINVESDSDRLAGFAATASPFTPERITSINAGAAYTDKNFEGSIGIGHSIEYTNNGCTSSAEWNPFTAADEIRISQPGDDIIIDGVEEPDVGAGRADYWIGNKQWPIKTTNSYDEFGVVVPGPTAYAPLNDTVDVTIPQGTATYGYASSPQGGFPSNCNQLDDDIDDALDELSSAISSYKGETETLIDESRPLNEEKDRLQLYAWSLLQAAASIRDDIIDIEERLSILRSKDYSEYEN